MEFVRNLLIEQRRRAVGTLMGYIEANVAAKLDRQQNKELRDQVLRTIGAYHDVCLDVLKSSVNDGSVVNEEALRLLGEIHQQVTSPTPRRHR